MVSQTTQGTAAAATQQSGTPVTTLRAKTNIRDFFRKIGMNSGAEIEIDLNPNKREIIKLSAQPGLGKPLKALQYKSGAITGDVLMVKYNSQITDLIQLTEFTLIVKTRKNTEREYTVKVIKKAEYVN